MIQELKNINAIKGQESYSYFGTYKNIEWILKGKKSNNKVWWYLTDNEGENPMPADNLKDATIAMKENIDYFIDNE